MDTWPNGLPKHKLTPEPQQVTAASISRIFKHFTTESLDIGIAILTADRGDRAYKTDANGELLLDKRGKPVKDKQRGAALNNKARKRLQGLLKSKGLDGWIVTKGGFKESTGDVEYEHSYIVPGVTRDEAKWLGKKLGEGTKINSLTPKEKLADSKSMEQDFRQDAILWGSNKAGVFLYDASGSFDKIGTKFEASTVQPYFTEWRNRRFAFSSFHDLEYCPSSPSDYRQWRRELVTECMKIGQAISP